MPAGIAAGHPITADVGLRLLEAGGSAADSAAGAVLASCAAETVLTGLGGGGFATYFNARTRTVTCLDFFCTVPGLDRPSARAASWSTTPVDISFGRVPLRFSIGGGTIAVPGVPAGIGALHRRWGRLPWQDVVAPAIQLAVDGVPLPGAHAATLAAIAPAMLPDEGSAGYAPTGRLLLGGEVLHHPGLAEAMTVLAEQGPAAWYTGTLGSRIVETVRSAGGVLSPTDLAAYQVRQVPVRTATVANHQILGRHDLNQVVAVLDRLSAPLAKLPAEERAVALAEGLLASGAEGYGSTTNLAVVDPEGNACVVTTTLGIGSGVWVPGTGLHLNSMLGEAELLVPGLRPGDRMPSNMCPLIVTSCEGRLILGLGSAGASRIRSALIHTLIAVLVDHADLASAIARPRFHVVAGARGTPATVHAEAGYPEAELSALIDAGHTVARWSDLNHYFGGVSGVGDAGAAGDPRRGGAGLVLARAPGRSREPGCPSKRGRPTSAAVV